MHYKYTISIMKINPKTSLYEGIRRSTIYHRKTQARKEMEDKAWRAVHKCYPGRFYCATAPEYKVTWRRLPKDLGSSQPFFSEYATTRGGKPSLALFVIERKVNGN